MNRSPARSILQMVVSCGGILMLAGGTRADLDFAATSVGKGEIRAGSPLSQQFTFKNPGLDDVEITDVQSSCGCLTSQLSGRRFSHGDQGSITVEINTLSPIPGPHTWQVKLVCRSGNGVRVIPLQFHAVVTDGRHARGMAQQMPQCNSVPVRRQFGKPWRDRIVQRYPEARPGKQYRQSRSKVFPK